MDTQRNTLPIRDMNSQRCASRVEEAITAVPTLASCRVDHASHSAVFSGDPTSRAVRKSVLAVREFGYQEANNKHLFQSSGITCGFALGV
ncbi:MAG: heavy-metal-associated domain-containing protein [Flavobacteriales bacterium]